jgi:hypothetical protein
MLVLIDPGAEGWERAPAFVARDLQFNVERFALDSEWDGGVYSCGGMFSWIAIYDKNGVRMRFDEYDTGQPLPPGGEPWLNTNGWNLILELLTAPGPGFPPAWARHLEVMNPRTRSNLQKELTTKRFYESIIEKGHCTFPPPFGFPEFAALLSRRLEGKEVSPLHVRESIGWRGRVHRALVPRGLRDSGEHPNDTPHPEGVPGGLTRGVLSGGDPDIHGDSSNSDGGPDSAPKDVAESKPAANPT